MTERKPVYDWLRVHQLTGLNMVELRELEERGEMPKRMEWPGTMGFWDVAEIDAWLAKRK